MAGLPGLFSAHRRHSTAKLVFILLRTLRFVRLTFHSRMEDNQSSAGDSPDSYTTHLRRTNEFRLLLELLPKPLAFVQFMLRVLPGIRVSATKIEYGGESIIPKISCQEKYCQNVASIFSFLFRNPSVTGERSGPRRSACSCLPFQRRLVDR